MKELSIFVDESGHFGMHQKHSPYYIVSFVFHNQSEDISGLVATYESYLSDIGFPNHFIHTEPIIRGESVYEELSLDVRRKLFNSLCRFATRCPVKHKTFLFRKDENDSKLQMIHKMSRDISLFLQDHTSLFDGFDTVKLYYDNGQSEITSIMTTVLSTMISNLEFKNATPSEYRLFQVADLLCTIELTQQKYKDNGKLSKSESFFFKTYQNFKKNYLATYKKLELTV